MVLFLRSLIPNWRGLLGLTSCIWLISLGLLTSCSKDSPPPSTGSINSTGSIEGTLLPVGGVTSVTATAADGQAYQAAPDPATGQLRFATLPAGAYTLTFTTILAYRTPSPVAVQVVAGTTTRPAFSTLTRDPTIRGTFRWTIGNETYTATRVNGEVSSILVSLSGLASVLGDSHEVAVVIPLRGVDGQPIFRGVGTYELGRGEFYPFGQYTFFRGGMNQTFSMYRTRYPVATGTVTVTRFDPQAFAIAGTFTFSAEAATNATGAVNVTQGQFDLTF